MAGGYRSPGLCTRRTKIEIRLPDNPSDDGIRKVIAETVIRQGWAYVLNDQMLGYNRFFTR